MPDITMCKGEEIRNGDSRKICPRRETCYRYTAKPNDHWQSYFVVAPFYNWNESCDYYYRDMSKFVEEQTA